MDILDTPTTLARVEKRLGIAALPSADSACIRIPVPIIPHFVIRGELGVVHDIRRLPLPLAVNGRYGLEGWFCHVRGAVLGLRWWAEIEFVK